MYRPRPHEGFVTIDAKSNILMHDTLLDAVTYAHEMGDPTLHVYLASFMPTVDILDPPMDDESDGPSPATLRLVNVDAS